MDPVGELQSVSRSFGAAAARRKRSLLRRIAGLKRIRVRDLRTLHDTLDFMRAYPDNADLRRAVLDTAAGLREHASAASLQDTGFPGSTNSYAYSYGVLLQMAQRFPGSMDIDWDAVEDDAALIDALTLLVSPGEGQGLEDIRITLREWLDGCKLPGQSDLDFLLDRFESADLPAAVRVHLFEQCDLAVRYEGAGRCEIAWPVERLHYQKTNIERERFAMPPRIRRPIQIERGSRELVSCALQALCVRNLEIYPLIYANPADVTLAHCGRGVQVALVGVQPEFRSPLESLYFFLVLKNGVPVAYGPASVFGGCCEMGINLFPEFRGGEIRYIYAQFMRVLHHHLGVDYFFLTSYGMGEGNEDAIRSGSFWFYRKLGFAAANPDVETLARAEEARMRARPDYRSDRRMLRRLSHTSAYLDLSRGHCAPTDFGRLGILQSQYLGENSEDRCAARVARTFSVPRRARAVRAMAPLLCMIPDLQRWSAPERLAMARALRAKDARSEAPAARLLGEHRRFLDALAALTG